MLPLGEQLDIFTGPPIQDWKEGQIVSFFVGNKEKKSQKQELRGVFLKNIGGTPFVHKRYKNLQTFSGRIVGSNLLVEGYYNPESKSGYSKGRITLLKSK